MPVKGYRVITISEETYKLLEALRRAREAEAGHRVSLNAVLLEVLKEYIVEERVL